MSLHTALPTSSSPAALWTFHKSICTQNKAYKSCKIQSSDLCHACCHLRNKKSNLHERYYFYSWLPFLLVDCCTILGHVACLQPCFGNMSYKERVFVCFCSMIPWCCLESREQHWGINWVQKEDPALRRSTFLQGSPFSQMSTDRNSSSYPCVCLVAILSNINNTVGQTTESNSGEKHKYRENTHTHKYRVWHK